LRQNTDTSRKSCSFRLLLLFPISSPRKSEFTRTGHYLHSACFHSIFIRVWKVAESASYAFAVRPAVSERISMKFDICNVYESKINIGQSIGHFT
jgi:hypothetical protein